MIGVYLFSIGIGYGIYFLWTTFRSDKGYMFDTNYHMPMEGYERNRI